MTDGEGVTTYAYDALDRLEQATYPTTTVTYTLDSVGNRLSDGVNSFAYDPSDRIMNPGYTYDANGNLLSDGVTSYVYDAANRLIQMTRSGVVTTYGYDGWGNLIQETTNGVTTEFVLDENTAYPRIMGEVRSDGGERLYAYGPEGFAAQLAVGEGIEYPLLDGLGSVRRLTDAAGTVILSRSYDAYGNVWFAAGTGSSRLGYTGELQDSVSGLVYLRARHYQPALGRFLQRDSFDGTPQLPQSFNRYSYAHNNPLGNVDPSGHDPLDSKWERDFMNGHNNRLPTDQDRRDRLYSLIVKGHGNNGKWTDDDWKAYSQDQRGHWEDSSKMEPGLQAGLDRFATHVDRLVTHYKESEKVQFVKAFAFIFASYPMGHPIPSTWDMVDPNDNHAQHPLLIEGNQGWDPDLVQGDNSDQAHHYAGLFYMGFWFGYDTGMAANHFRDGLCDCGPFQYSPEDLRLGDLAAWHGAMLLIGQISIHELGGISKDGKTCAPPWFARWPGQ